MIKAVIFDWGGVIAKEENGGWQKAFEKLLELPPEQAKKIWTEAYVGLNTNEIDESDFWERVEKRLNMNLPASKSRVWFNGIAREVWPEMSEFVTYLQSKGIHTAILSNTIRIISKEFRKENVYKGFSPILLSDEEGIAKPDIRIYEMMLEKLSLKAEECVFIDDRPSNLEPAKKLGIITVLAQTRPKETIKLVETIINER